MIEYQGENWLTAAEAGATVGLHKDTILHAMKRGNMAYRRIVRGPGKPAHYVSEAEFERWRKVRGFIPPPPLPEHVLSIVMPVEAAARIARLPRQKVYEAITNGALVARDVTGLGRYVRLSDLLCWRRRFACSEALSTRHFDDAIIAQFSEWLAPGDAA